MALLFVLLIVIGMLLASNSALTQFAKRGTYTSHFAWQAVTKASEIDKGHTLHQRRVGRDQLPE